MIIKGIKSVVLDILMYGAHEARYSLKQLVGSIHRDLRVRITGRKVTHITLAYRVNNVNTAVNSIQFL